MNFCLKIRRKLNRAKSNQTVHTKKNRKPTYKQLVYHTIVKQRGCSSGLHLNAKASDRGNCHDIQNPDAQNNFSSPFNI